MDVHNVAIILHEPCATDFIAKATSRPLREEMAHEKPTVTPASIRNASNRNVLHHEVHVVALEHVAAVRAARAFALAGRLVSPRLRLRRRPPSPSCNVPDRPSPVAILIALYADLLGNRVMCVMCMRCM